MMVIIIDWILGDSCTVQPISPSFRCIEISRFIGKCCDIPSGLESHH